MKKLLAMLCCMAIVLTLFPIGALAADPGDGNIDNGGGGMGSGTSKDFWNSGNDGVRITVVDATTGGSVSSAVDFANRNQPSTLVHFGKTNKLQYLGGASLSPQSGVAYSCRQPANAMPTIISGGGRSNIVAIKKYFCSEYACMMVADATGMNYDELISGKYKLLLEPIGYFTHNGIFYCMTATQAALYDQLANGSLRSKMPSLTHQNLPLAMFLEYGDLGISAWSGSTSGKKTNADIINYLGVGIVRFTEAPQELETPDVEYRVDTDVITSVTLETGSRLTPDNPARVVFSIMGRSYTVDNIVIPENDSQVVWVKWHTPSTPQTIEISVSVQGAHVAKSSFKAKIVDLNENPPPDPLATDTYPGYAIPPVPRNSQKATANWGVWNCYWVPNWVWYSDWDWIDTSYTGADGTEVSDGYWEDNGEWVDEGDWEYDYTAYSASITGHMSLLPDDAVPTASGKNMKSGYGVKTDVSATLSTNASSGHYTYPQTAFSVFPEFNYEVYLRLLKRTSGGFNANFIFKENEYSTYNRCVHFLPIWFPDNSRYTVYTQVWDTWTPDGMLSVELTDYVQINQSLFDDWYTNRE